MAYKELLAAGVIRDFRFSCKQSYLAYCRNLSSRKIYYMILESRLCDDGTVLARVIQQYNNADLIVLPQSDLEV